MNKEFNPPKVETCEELDKHPAEFKEAIVKIVRSHAVNELYGARVFDEPAISLAPTPYAKWLTCRVAMEEYGHHVRFKELGDKLNIPTGQMTPEGKNPLSIFEFPLQTWEEFCVIKLLADLAEILQVEDLWECSFLPLRNLARMTMPEEKFHAKFGEDFTTEIIKHKDGKKRIQDAINRYYPMLPAFFGRPNSKNNAIYRKWGIKKRKNEEMLQDYLDITHKLVVDKLGLELPNIH
jgi:ring-1,2-phenylacetyl-CoA epoxidase subunit PaaA